MIAGLIISAAVLLGAWPVFSAPVSHYPVTTDAMGHLTKIKYLADCLKELKWPSWFPYWYCGSTVIQYYPPLSFVLLVPVQMLFDNVMITYKTLVFFSQFLGALGVWYFGFRFAERWTGIAGGAFYALHPYLLRSLLFAGTIAQWPVYALTPWWFLFSVLWFRQGDRRNWLLVCILTALLVLSHPMHAYLICVGMGIVLVVLFFCREISFLCLMQWTVAVALGTALTAFWSLPGVTQWETPGVPYLLPEASAMYSSQISWFMPSGRHQAGFYFGLSFVLISFLALVAAVLERSQRESRFWLALLIGLGAVIFLSFGEKVSVYNYLPMHKSLVPGRFLSFAALLVSLLLVYTVSVAARSKKKVIFTGGVLLCLIVTAADIDPRAMPLRTDPFWSVQEEINLIPASDNPFRTGRFTWVSPVGSETTYFPMLRGLNMADGWNIEGTPHNRAIWQHNIAIPIGCGDYVIRNLLQWNVRAVMVSNSYQQLQERLKEAGFAERLRDAGKTLLISSLPSSYFMQMDRNAIAIGKAAAGLVMHFPWIVQGVSYSLEDYSPQELAPFRLIYLIEPEVKDLRRFEEKLRALAAAGKMVIIEPGKADFWPVGGSIPYREKVVPGACLSPGPVAGSLFNSAFSLGNDVEGELPVIGNLDEVWLEMVAGGVRAPVVGWKNVDGGRVYFVGLALGQQLGTACGGQIKALLERLMDLAAPRKEIFLLPFEVQEAEWGHDSFQFRYSADKTELVWVSVTYSRRWKAFLDGEPLLVRNLENLILLELPAGEHEVILRYGMTWVSWLGIGIALLALLMLVLIYRWFAVIAQRTNEILCRARRFLEEIGAGP